MSNPLKAVGKVFKKVVKVVKKVALPALAIAAVAITGGAALGIGALAGGIPGVLGVGGALGSVLGAAGTGALIGAAGAAVTGKNILKGATGGMLMGAATGGLSAALNPAAAAAHGTALAAKGAGAVASTTGAATNIVKDAASMAGKTAAGGGLGSVTSSALPAVAEGSSFSQAFAPIAQGGTSAAANVGSEIVVNGTRAASGLGSAVKTAAPALAAAGVASTVSQAPDPSPPIAQQAGQQPVAAAPRSSGLGGFLASQPYLLPSILQGIGGGMSATAEAEALMERDAARQRDIEDNYSMGGFFGRDINGNPVGNGSYGYAAPATRSQWVLDPITGKPYRDLAPAGRG